MKTETATETTVSPDEPPPLTCEPCLAAGRKARSTSTPGLDKNSQKWLDWQWQMKYRIRSVRELKSRFPSIETEMGIARAAEKFPLAITPYYASLIRRADSSDPVYQMCVPQLNELYDPPFLSDDPLEEDEDMPAPGLVHRYRDRALFIVTTTCAAYCRHCTRKRVAGSRECSVSSKRLQQVANYLAAHPEISDVVVSGGDPLTMATSALERVLATLRAVPSVQVIRIGTRTPVVLPQRITDELTSMLRRYHPIWINTHFNHPNELTPEAAQACARLADAGIPLGNQSVLLKGVNDDARVIEELCRGLVRMRVRPYYLFQCDLVRGVEHFRTPLSKGIEIMEYLRGRLGGLAIPQFVVDAPHGGGKIPVLPTYIVSTSPTHTVLRNFEGMLVAYPEPGPHAESEALAKRFSVKSEGTGVWELSGGDASYIQPAHSERQSRRKRETKRAFDASTDSA